MSVIKSINALNERQKNAKLQVNKSLKPIIIPENTTRLNCILLVSTVGKHYNYIVNATT